MKEMQETWVPPLGREDALEEEMATHSGILTWRILWTEEPGGLHGVAELDMTEHSMAGTQPMTSSEVVSKKGKEEGADGDLCCPIQSLHVVGLGVHLVF